MIFDLGRRLRRKLPAPVKAGLARLRRRLRDRLTGVGKSIVTEIPADGGADCIKVISLAQPVRHTAHWQGKVHNLQLASRRLNGFVLQPGKILSFWALVGAPTPGRGFQVGRSIRGGILGADVGGGLCQLSGLAYELGLRAGLEVIERHAHTRDLYTEASRFTPLGLDATVVWGHKDLRLRNNLAHRLVFVFDVAADEIRGRVLAPQSFAPSALVILGGEDGEAQRRCVTVYRTGADGRSELVGRDSYAPPA